MQEGCWWVSDRPFFLNAISFDIPFSSANAHLLYIYLFGSKPHISLSKHIDPLTAERKFYMPETHAFLCPSVFHLNTVFPLCKSSVFSRTHILVPYLHGKDTWNWWDRCWLPLATILRPQYGRSAFLALSQWQVRCFPRLLAQLTMTTGGAKRDSVSMASADRIEPDGTTPV